MVKSTKSRVDIVVPCSSGKHKVRLKPGRFLSSARCPKCGSWVDPTRVRRILAVARSLLVPSGAHARTQLLVWSVWTYLGLLLLLSVGFWIWADRWAPMTVLLFGPRWVLLVPVPVLGIAALWFKRRLLLLPLVAAVLVALGPIMGFTLGWGRFFGGESTGMKIRVVTFNVAGASRLNTSLPWIMEETRADIIAFQECGSPLQTAVRELHEIAWHTSIEDQMCLVSRYPISNMRQLDRDNIRVADGAGIVLTHTIDLGDRVLQLTNLHLDTPRKGLAPVREGNLSEGFNTLRSKSVVRDIESRQARAWVESDSGLIAVVGDFNLPVESVIYRRHWGDMVNAYSLTGTGFGYTRYAGWIRARIDHVLVGPGLSVQEAFVGPDFGSDHRPMIADLVVDEQNQR